MYISDIHLSNIGPVALSRVCYIAGDFVARTRSRFLRTGGDRANGEIAISKSGVGEPVAKHETRFDPAAFVSSCSRRTRLPCTRPACCLLRAQDSGHMPKLKLKFRSRKSTAGGRLASIELHSPVARDSGARVRNGPRAPQRVVENVDIAHSRQQERIVNADVIGEGSLDFRDNRAADDCHNQNS